MLQSPNYIHFRNQWQLLGLEGFGRWPDKSVFKQLGEKLEQALANVDFDDFSYRVGSCEMGKLRGEGPDGGPAFKKLVIKPREITLVDEWTETTAEGFMGELVETLRCWFAVAPNTAIIAQRCCLRALVEPVVVRDSREFLGDKIMQVGKGMRETFKEMPFKVGFTFTSLRKTGDYQLYIDTTVNSWRDNKRVWVQVEGLYPMEKPVNAANPERTKVPFEDCKSFLENEVLSFLNQYDQRKE